jgi:zinc transporter ZupT
VEHDHGPSATSGHGHASPSHARSDLGDRGEHATVGWTVLFGLSVHAFTAGLGLAATLSRPDLAASVFISIISHKGVEGFSLTTVFMLAGFGRRKILALIGAFALVTPAGVLLGSLLRQHLDNFGVEIMMALAAGTFLFVALGDLLPEVFHRRIDAAYKVLLLLAGIAVSFLIHL